MKKSTIWTIATVMFICLVTLLGLQMKYFNEVISMRREQFDENAKRSLWIVSHRLAMNEVRAQLDPEIFKDVENDTERKDLNILLEDAVYSILYQPSYLPLSERIDAKNLDRELKQAFQRSGITIDYHFRVTTSDGREVCKCKDFVASTKEKNIYKQELFPNDPPAQMGVLEVHFIGMRQYLLSSVSFMAPALIFTGVLFIVFFFTVWTAFRQKRLAQIKNDFVNNMTHELKTPISSISLAAQMLADKNMPKTEASLERLSGVIVDESKRLRFLVEKVLQMSMFDKGKPVTFKQKKVDANNLIQDVVNTFRLKVENTGGSIDTNLAATNSVVFVDEMHFTNVIFNLMDNAVKYRDESRDLHLHVSTHNEGSHLVVRITDNGIGIHKEDVKKIFDKFYRVSTGNRHDVKGFGLGLAYVKNVIVNHQGNITAESEYGKGTTFIISLPHY